MPPGHMDGGSRRRPRPVVTRASGRVMCYPCTWDGVSSGAGTGVPVVAGAAMRQGDVRTWNRAGRGHRRLPVCAKHSYDLHGVLGVDLERGDVPKGVRGRAGRGRDPGGGACGRRQATAAGRRSRRGRLGVRRGTRKGDVTCGAAESGVGRTVAGSVGRRRAGGAVRRLRCGMTHPRTRWSEGIEGGVLGSTQ